ncbi:MAG: 50S ribosomal protein L15 [Planctomycetota bacterium]|jgi:large subunit ribosomal protein L15
MNLAEAKALGLKFPERKRIGRGVGSGLGKTSGRGHKGAKARSGWSRRIGWEGGQMPLYRRVPKRGFNNKNFEKVFTVVNVSDLDVFDAGAEVDLKAVLARGLASKEKHSELFKVLGDGAIKKAITVKVDAITATARTKIEGAGGKVILIEKRPHREKFVAKDGVKRQPGAKKAGRSAK